jgi:hypothetical protein
MNLVQLDRRRFLRGAGVALGLPLLEGLRPSIRRLAAAETVSAPRRMAVVFFPNGAIMPNWKPQSDGPQWQLSQTLAPLAPFKQKLNVIEGLAHDNGRAGKDGAGDHARSSATFLTATRPVKTAGNIKVGISADQVVAQHLTGATKLPSIELGLSDSQNAGSCDSGYSCAYSSNISWRSESQPMSKETIPQQAFERLFGDGTSEGKAERDFFRRSVLDLVARDAESLHRQLGSRDRQKLDEYFTNVRELEQRIAASADADQAARPDIQLPQGRPERFAEHTRLMMDLMVLAFQTDTTRVATFMLDNEGSNRVYAEVDVHEGHHELSHHRNEQQNIEKIKRIDLHLAEQFAYLLNRLDSVSEGERSLLDNSLVLYGSGLSDGNRHLHHDLPIVLAGSGGGQIATDRLIRLSGETPMANLYLSMFDLLGVPVDEFGDATGRLTSLA